MVETIQSKNTSIKSKRNWQLKLVLLWKIKRYLQQVLNNRLKWMKIKTWMKKTTSLFGSGSWNKSNPTSESKNHPIRPTTRAKRQKNKRSSCEIMTIHQITREGRHEKQKKLRWNGTNLTLEVKQYLCAHRICPLKKIYLNASNW